MSKTKRKAKRTARQDGGTFLGLILGMMIGLGIALGVAFYVSRLPNPFVAKNPSRLASREAIDHSKDPNAALRSRGEVQPLPPVEKQQTTEDDLHRAVNQREAPLRTAEQQPAAPQRQSADPLGDLVAARSRAYESPRPQPAPQQPPYPQQSSDPFTYYVQAGAFRQSADAEAQRARLLLLGVQANVTQRDQAGRPIWRVRVGPFQNQDAADRTKARLAENGFDAALVRVQR